MNSFFNTKGPIKPPSSQSDQASAIAIQSMIQQQHQQQHMAAMQGRHMQYADDEYYDEEDASGDKHVNLGQMMEDNLSEGGDNQRYTNGRQLTAEEEEMILSELLYSAQDNREFMKVLHILQNDGELRPLIFEHEALLRTLKDVKELKAEQMLSILTAAETEMYESSKKNEELIQ